MNQIQQLLGLICIDSLQFTFLQSERIKLDQESVANQPEADRCLVQSPEHIAAIHESLNRATCTDAEPFPLLLLAWAWILRQLPPWLQPDHREADSVHPDHLYQTVIQVVLGSQLDLFGKWDRILTGRLLWQEGPGSERAEDVIAYKDISRCEPCLICAPLCPADTVFVPKIALFSALLDCVRPEYVPDYKGLVQVWCSLHGEVSDGIWAAVLHLSFAYIEMPVKGHALRCLRPLQPILDEYGRIRFG